MTSSPTLLPPLGYIPQDKIYLTSSVIWDYISNPTVILSAPAEDLAKRLQSFLLGGWKPFGFGSSIFTEDNLNISLESIEDLQQEKPELVVFNNVSVKTIQKTLETVEKYTSNVNNNKIFLFITSETLENKKTPFPTEILKITLPAIWTPPPAEEPTELAITKTVEPELVAAEPVEPAQAEK